MSTATIHAEIRSLTRQLKALRRKLRGSPASPFKGETRKQAKAKRHEAAAERRRRVYAEVDARSKGKCECGPGCNLAARERDHFFGRGKTAETAATVWHLSWGCHFNKTRNYPSRATWLEWFRAHCQRHGYTAQVAHCDAFIAIERAQHAR